jgi:hypothetical protein
MSQYLKVAKNPPKLTIKKGTKEVIFKTISCMCDNIGYLRFKKNNDGEFKMSGNGFAISNWQIKHEQHEIEWVSDEENWDKVTKMINTGTSVIESVISR